SNLDEKMLQLLPPFKHGNIHIKDDTKASTSPKEVRIGTLSVAEQEALMLEDLLYGFDGKYIKRKDRVMTEEDGFRMADLRIDPSVDHSLADLTQRILPLAAHYRIVQQFIDTRHWFKYGKVSHALAAAMRALVKDYLVLVAQLEHQVHFAPGFGLQRLWMHVTPTMQVMATLSSLANAVRDAEAVGRDESDASLLRSVTHELHASTRGGGVVLSVIADRMMTMSGNPTTKALYSHLLERSAVPYISILRAWIHTGEIHDPYDEFMVQERRGLTKEHVGQDFNDVYWEQRYTLRRDGIPPFLAPVAGRVLLAGKYLNVVRECGEVIPELEGRVVRVEGVEAVVKGSGGELQFKSGEFGDVVGSIDKAGIVEDIDLAYRYANQTLLDLLVKDKELINRLRSIKHYFLLAQSDFLTHFLDIAYSKLLKPRREVSVERLRSILELVVRNPASVSSADPYKDDLSIELEGTSLIEHLMRVNSVVGMESRSVLRGGSGAANRSTATLDGKSKVFGEEDEIAGMVGAREKAHLRGIDSMILSYAVDFPVSLVLNRKIMTKYQLLFRHLLHCKNVERLLGSAWMDQIKFRTVRDALRRLRVKTTTASSRPRRASAPGPGSRSASVTKDKEQEPAATVENPFLEETVAAEAAEEAAFILRMSVVRARMLHFIQQLLHFLCYEVIEPNWQRMEAALAKVTTVDEILRHHENFLDTALKDCMLTSPKLLKLFSRLMTNCVSFTAFAGSFMTQRKLYRTDPNAARNLGSNPALPSAWASTSAVNILSHDLSEYETDATLFATLRSGSPADAALRRLDEGQAAAMRALINALQFSGAVAGAAGSSSGGDVGSACFVELVTRIDFNMYYARASTPGLAGAVFG
ncbi:Gamma-tubulin complex component 2, partial [Irineochytrium annulatum]